MADLHDKTPFLDIILPSTHDSAADEEFIGEDPNTFLVEMRPVFAKVLGVSISILPTNPASLLGVLNFLISWTGVSLTGP